MLPKQGPKALTKGKMAEELAAATGLKRKETMALLNSLADVAHKEVKKFGKFSVPKILRVKTRSKPARPAQEIKMFGKMVAVKAKPATKTVRAYCAGALKKSV